MKRLGHKAFLPQKHQSPRGSACMGKKYVCMYEVKFAVIKRKVVDFALSAGQLPVQ